MKFGQIYRYLFIFIYIFLLYGFSQSAFIQGEKYWDGVTPSGWWGNREFGFRPVAVECSFALVGSAEPQPADDVTTNSNFLISIYYLVTSKISEFGSQFTSWPQGSGSGFLNLVNSVATYRWPTVDLPLKLLKISFYRNLPLSTVKDRNLPSRRKFHIKSTGIYRWKEIEPL
jgi:hypothetical protein